MSGAAAGTRERRALREIADYCDHWLKEMHDYGPDLRYLRRIARAALRKARGKAAPR